MFQKKVFKTFKNFNFNFLILKLEHSENIQKYHFQLLNGNVRKMFLDHILLDG